MINEIHHGDCLELMQHLPAGSVDMILCDLPYGTTACKWDTIIPFDKLWSQYERVIKPNGAIVLTAAQPFTSALVMSNAKRFRYDWVWQKEKGTGHLNAKRAPLRDKEDILIFSLSAPPYFPQLTTGLPYGNKRGRNTESYGAHKAENNPSPGTRYPKQVLRFDSVGAGGLHPTQKPVALFEYLIRTYTNPGDVVLDNCAGSGTTAVAAENTGRRWICMEQEAKYVTIARARVASLQTTLTF